MKKAELDKSEKIIRAGLAEAERFLRAVAEEMKQSAPGIPIGVLEIQARRASNNTVAAALFRIGELRKELQQSETAA